MDLVTIQKGILIKFAFQYMWGEKEKSTKQMNGTHKPTSSVNYAGMFAIMIPYPHSHDHEF